MSKISYNKHINNVLLIIPKGAVVVSLHYIQGEVSGQNPPGQPPGQNPPGQNPP